MFAAIDLRYALQSWALRALKRIALAALPFALAVGAYFLLR